MRAQSFELFQAKNGRFCFKSCALMLQKQFLNDEIKIYCSPFYCVLSTVLKSNFEPLFDPIKNFRKISKAFHTKWVKKSCVFISAFPQQLGKARVIVVLWINTRCSYQCNMSSFGSIFGEIYAPLYCER
jgi:hypothetical protein